MRKRSIQVPVRLSTEEYELLNRQVKKTKLSREAYIRMLIKRYIPKEQPPLDYHALIKEIRAVGNRINQIAAKANAIGFIKADEYEQHYNEYSRIINSIMDIVTLPERITPDGHHKNMEG